LAVRSTALRPCIRAPAITETGSKVEPLAWVMDERQDQTQEVTVAARQDTILVTAFHPELTDDVRWHRLFLEMVLESCSGRSES